MRGVYPQCEEENERLNEGGQRGAVRERDPRTIVSDSVSMRAHSAGPCRGTFTVPAGRPPGLLVTHCGGLE